MTLDNIFNQVDGWFQELDLGCPIGQLEPSAGDRNKLGIINRTTDSWFKTLNNSKVLTGIDLVIDDLILRDEDKHEPSKQRSSCKVVRRRKQKYKEEEIEDFDSLAKDLEQLLETQNHVNQETCFYPFYPSDESALQLDDTIGSCEMIASLSTEKQQIGSLQKNSQNSYSPYTKVTMSTQSHTRAVTTAKITTACFTKPPTQDHDYIVQPSRPTCGSLSTGSKAIKRQVLAAIGGRKRIPTVLNTFAMSEYVRFSDKIKTFAPRYKQVSKEAGLKQTTQCI